MAQWYAFSGTVGAVSKSKPVSEPGTRSRRRAAFSLTFWVLLGGLWSVVLLLMLRDEDVDIWVVLLVLAGCAASGIALSVWMEAALAARATATNTATNTATSKRPPMWFLLACAGLGSALTRASAGVVVFVMAAGVSMSIWQAVVAARELRAGRTHIDADHPLA